MNEKQAEILSYWFGSIESSDYPVENPEMYWKKNPDIDADIKKRFVTTSSARTTG